MGALHFHAVVGVDHKIEIALPESVPPGPVDVIVNVPENSGGTARFDREAMKRQLDELRLLREKYKDRSVTLSDAVMENRREERY